MFYRENGQFKTNYRADQQIFPIAQDRIFIVALVLAAFIVVPLLATDYFDGTELGRVMAIIVPVNTVGQVWFPSLLSLLWAATGSYRVPILVTFACILTGRLALALLPAPRR
mgnify:CR=1 FL=1